MTEQDIFTQIGLFLWENGFSILFVVIVLIVITLYIVLNDIKFETPKTKVERVVVLEKFNNGRKPPSFKEMQQDIENDTDNKTCVNFSDKSGCTALGGCVWVTADNGNVKKCQQGNNDGPTDLCYCKPNKKGVKGKDNGSLIPWDEYYYLDDSATISKKKPKPTKCSGKCSPQ